MRCASTLILGVCLAVLCLAACGGGGGGSTGPAAPTDLQAEAFGFARIRLTWTDPSADETGFEIERSLTSGSGYTLIHSAGPDMPAYTDSDLVHSTRYYYRVRCTYAADASAWSSESSATSSAAVWVDAASGNDAGAGTRTDPFLTISKGIQDVGPDGVISVEPGRYDTTLGETFPLEMAAGQRILGDAGNYGVGVTPTTIDGEGAVPGTTHFAAILPGPGCSIHGFQFANSALSNFLYSVYAIDAEVEVTRCTFTNSVYGGVRLERAGASNVHDNAFDSFSYAFYCEDCPDAPTFQNNTVVRTSIPVNLVGSSTNARILENTISGTGSSGIQVQHGIPEIIGNTFNKDTGYTHGAIRSWFATAAPYIRRNTFLCTLAVKIDGGQPNLGTAADPGGNVFTGVTGTSIDHAGSNTVEAVGNTFPNAPPTCGTDIVTTGGGHVIWNTDPVQMCP